MFLLIIGREFSALLGPIEGTLNLEGDDLSFLFFRGFAQHFTVYEALHFILLNIVEVSLPNGLKYINKISF